MYSKSIWQAVGRVFLCKKVIYGEYGVVGSLLIMVWCAGCHTMGLKRVKTACLTYLFPGSAPEERPAPPANTIVKHETGLQQGSDPGHKPKSSSTAGTRSSMHE